MTTSQEMYEAKWHRYFFPAPMISYLKNIGASPRKLRLFACACFRMHLAGSVKLRGPGRSGSACDREICGGHGEKRRVRIGVSRGDELHWPGGS